MKYLLIFIFSIMLSFLNTNAEEIVVDKNDSYIENIFNENKISEQIKV